MFLFICRRNPDLQFVANKFYEFIPDVDGRIGWICGCFPNNILRNEYFVAPVRN